MTKVTAPVKILGLVVGTCTINHRGDISVSINDLGREAGHRLAELLTTGLADGVSIVPTYVPVENNNKLIK